MTAIFDCESELGRCDAALLNDPTLPCHTVHPAVLFAHTLALRAGTSQWVKIEQRCFVRLGDEIADQPWVKPYIRLESAAGPNEAVVRTIRQLHRQFIAQARAQLPDDCLAPSAA